MALTQLQPTVAMRPQVLSEKARGKKRSFHEISDSNKSPAMSSDARLRGTTLAFVDRVFTNFKKGNRQDYYDLVAHFNIKTLHQNALMLQRILEALTQSIAQFDAKHHLLAQAIIDLPWAILDEPFVRTYVRFVCVLVAARPEYLKSTLEKAVHGFRWHSASIYRCSLCHATNFEQCMERADNLQQHVELESPLTRREIYNRLHYLLSTVISVIPSAPATLLPLLERTFPPQRERKDAQIVYYSNVLKIIEYVPALTEGILEICIARAIKIDVEIQVDIEDLEEYEGALDDAIFGHAIEDPFNRRIAAKDDESESEDSDREDTLPFDFDDLSSDEDVLSEGENTLNGHREETDILDKPEVVTKLKELASKLDSILQTIFQQFERLNQALDPPTFLSPQVPSPTKTSFETIDQDTQRQTFFHALLTVFDRVILKTFKTRHTQFLLFWYSSLHPALSDTFTATLVQTALYDEHRSVVERISASAYLGSYIARARFLPAQNVRLAVGYLCDWLSSQYQMHSVSPAASVVTLTDAAPQPRGSKARQLALFYAVFQSIVYVFCYRWKDLYLSADVDDVDEDLTFTSSSSKKNWMPELDIVKEIIFSHLNPLKVGLFIALEVVKLLSSIDDQFCSANVRRQFVRISHHVTFAYCYNLTNSVNGRRLSSSPDGDATPLATERPAFPLLSSSSSLKIDMTQHAVASMLEEAKLETHFPFDPYKLPLTAGYIEGIFKEFEAPEGMEENEQDADDSIDESEEAMPNPSSVSGSSNTTEADDAFSTSFDDQLSLGS